MSDLDLFEEGGEAAPAAHVSELAGGDELPDPGAPLAARMRPRTLDEFRGQEHLLGPGKAIRAMLDAGQPTSMILWGPPGSGKTTLARIIARETDVTFIPFSAVTEGIARVRRKQATGRRTILFCDEIHRFNKAQQDAFLPHVEAGTVILVGATTENPSFEIIRPLLSRAPVYVLNALSALDLEHIVREALASKDRGLGDTAVEAEEDAVAFLGEAADGDARRALGVLEAAAGLVGESRLVTVEAVREALQHRYATYDKGGEEHYNLISALHKAVRGSDPDGALYWLARMLDGGEDPLFLARRLVRMASEDIGIADPAALGMAVAARDAYHFLGSPEGELALAQAVLYLATAPKSNRAYEAWSAALARARQTPGEPVPLHIRNAPTDLMKDLGYGKGYKYDPAETDGLSAQTYLPDRLEGETFYRPGRFGFEKTVAERLEWWAKRRGQVAKTEGGESDEE